MMSPTASAFESDRRSDLSSFALELLGIRKVYGATAVLRGIDFRLRPGSIHALLGANGAGKSTLLKIAVGATPATSGRILVRGKERHFTSPFEARKAGIGMVFQERSLVPDLSTVDNIFLNTESKRAGLIDSRAQSDECRRIFDRLGVHISSTALVGQLGIADQQMVEIAKALRLASAVLILDEPTAALTEREVQRLFTVVRQIARTGVGIVHVSHRLAEVFDLCDEVTIVRDGRIVLSTTVDKTNMQEIVETIAGGNLQEARHVRKKNTWVAGVGEATSLLEVKGLRVGTKLKDISFNLRREEILGVAGLAGSGRSTLLKALFGIVAPQNGDIRLDGRSLKLTSPDKAIRQGIYLIPENRKTEGLVLSHSVEANLVISILRSLCATRLPFVSGRRSTRIAIESIAQLLIHPPDHRRPVEWLSGGNQQKVVLGKAFNASGELLLLDEPTFGVDVRSRAEIRARVRSFADAGNGVIWVTSDLQELTDVSDRVLFLADGRVRNIVQNWPKPLAETEITHLIQSSD
jgi:ribose transport system ATP-binding protein